MIPLSDRVKRRLGLAVVALTGLFVVTSLILSIAAGEPAIAIETFLLGLTFGIVIALSLRAQPHNGAVWALVWAFFFGVLSDVGSRVVVNQSDIRGSDILGGEVSVSPADLDFLVSVGLVAELVFWVPGIYVLAIHALLLFPGGQTTSPLWRGVARVTIAIMALLTLVGIMRTGPWQTTPYDEIVHETFGVYGWLGLLQAPLQLAAVASLVHLVRRYRRSTGEERLQYRWVVWALGMFVANFFLYSIWAMFDVERIASTVALANIAVAFGIAIAKYRLYDIDVIISKSVMYLGLLAAITALYAAVVVGPLLVIGASDDGGPGLVLPILATGIVAVLFDPIRSRMQAWANRLVYGNRSSPHDVLSQATSRLATSEDANIDDLARLVAEGTGADRAVVWVDRDESLDVVGQWSVGDSSPPPPMEPDEFSALVDVRHEHQRLGVIGLTKPHNDPVTPADRELLANVAAGAGLGLRNVRLNRELEARAAEVRESRRRLIAAQDKERRRLERDLHDGAQQQVVALKVKLGIAKKIAEREHAKDIASRIVGLAGDTQEAVDALRQVAHGIYPPLLESEGLEPALRAVERTSRLPIELEASDLERYEGSIEETAYFCVTETLERARMSGATHARVEVAGRNGDLVARIGVDSIATELDLRAVADRLDAAGGTLTVEDQPDRRRRIVSSLPLHHIEGAKP